MRKKNTALRRSRGNLLIFAIAMLSVLVAIGAVYGVNLTRFMGAHQEQVSAVESAALVAARDLEKIVVDDPFVGLVSLATFPPTGKGTLAQDDFYMPVQGINSLLATVRLETVLADKFDDETLRRLAKRDYDLATQARVRLVDVLKSAILKDGVGYDYDGNKVEPLKDAEAAYLAASQRMAAGKTTLVKDSISLELGLIDGLVTNTRVPNPSTFAEMEDTAQQSGFYRAYVNVPFKNYNFVFAGISDGTNLVDGKLFKLTEPSLPYVIPAIVRCHADQLYEDPNPGHASEAHTVHVSACAQPGSLGDTKPSAGVLSLTFPSGAIPEITTLHALLMEPQIVTSPSDVTQAPMTGDSPPETPVQIKVPIVNDDHAPVGQLMRIAFFDWVRRAGPNMNVQSLIDALDTPLSDSAQPHRELFMHRADGTITHTTRPQDPAVSLPISDRQFYAASGLALHSNDTFSYDFYIRDYCFQPGRTNGGKHGGEPLGDAPPTPPPPVPGDPPLALDEYPALISAFPTGPGGGANRPTYNNPGVAVDFRLERR